MAFSTCDIALLAATAIITILDIVLAFCFQFVLPYHITRAGFYPADGRKLSYDEAVTFCPCIAEEFYYVPTHQLTLGEIPSRRRRSANYDLWEQLEKYPFLVSLSMPAFHDDIHQKIFACNGLIQSSEWLLTSKTCVKDDSEWFNLTVRSDSAYWWSYGQEHVVVDVSFINSDSLVALKVSPEFLQRLVPAPAMEYPFSGEWQQAVSLGWDDDMYRRPSNFRYKYEPFEVEEWTSKVCGSKTTNVCHTKNNCEMSSKFLVTSSHQVIGIKLVGGDECDRFVTLESSKRRKILPNKSCYKIYKDDCLLGGKNESNVSPDGSFEGNPQWSR